jgi:hypothetical protein
MRALTAGWTETSVIRTPTGAQSGAIGGVDRLPSHG